MVPTISFTNNPNFKPYKIGQLLDFHQRPCKLEPNGEYQLVTVKRRNEGIVSRGIFKGADIKTPSQFYIEAGDFLISKRQIVHGACEIVPSELDGAIVSNEYTIATGKDNTILTPYFNLLSKTSTMKTHYFLSSYGVDIEKMVFNLEDWKKKIINIPSIEEQKNVVAFFKTLNNKIQLQQEKIDLLKEQKKGFLQKMFPKIGETQSELRFDGFTKDWKYLKLGLTQTYFTDGNYGESYPSLENMADKNTGIPFLRGSDLKNGYLDVSTANYITKEKHSELISGHIKKDDIVIAVRGSLGSLGYATEENVGWNINSQLAIIRTDKSELDGRFLIQYFLSSRGQKELLSRNTGTALKQLPIKQLKDVPVPLVSIEEQQKIGFFFKSLDKKIALQQKQLELLLKQKQAYMQQMFI